MEIIENKRVRVPLQESRFIRAYELILNAEAQLESAKTALTCGQSPYVNLEHVKNYADKAQTEWHIQADKED